MKIIRRIIGFTALAFAIICFILFCIMIASGRLRAGLMVPLLLGYGFGIITAIACLIADVIRFIGKCFSQGANAAQPQMCSKICPKCGRALNSNVRFCSECGNEVTETL